MISTDAENLDVQALERAKVGLPGRQVGHSHRREVDAIELEEDELLSTELAQTDVLPRGAGKCEVRHLLPDLRHCRYPGTGSPPTGRPAPCPSEAGSSWVSAA
jgi:hypothetical protein